MVFGLHVILDGLLKAPKLPLETFSKSETFLGDLKPRRPAVVGIRLESDEPRFREDVRDPLHVLPCRSQVASDLRDRATGPNSREHVPTGAGLILAPRDLLSPPLVEPCKEERFLHHGD